MSEGSAAARHSDVRARIRGRWWKTALALLVAGLLAGILSGVVSGAVTALAIFSGHDPVALFFIAAIGGTAGAIVSTPFSAAYHTVLYFDLRVRKEAFDLQLLASRLGVDPPPGWGSPPPPQTQPRPPFWPRRPAGKHPANDPRLAAATIAAAALAIVPAATASDATPPRSPHLPRAHSPTPMRSRRYARSTMSVGGPVDLCVRTQRAGNRACWTVARSRGDVALDGNIGSSPPVSAQGSSPSADLQAARYPGRCTGRCVGSVAGSTRSTTRSRVGCRAAPGCSGC